VAIADQLGDSAGSVGQRDGVVGDALTLMAAGLYACYTVMLRMLMPHKDEGDIMLFFGLLGLFNIVLFAPGCVLMQLTGAVDLWSLSRSALGLALLKGAPSLC
jgi:solute carrier family 35, member F5